ncbi:MAG: penicillin-binding protein [Ferruginibacter sp.]|nr:penicillin-binding protein [Ferruginibacter sp.]
MKRSVKILWSTFFIFITLISIVIVGANFGMFGKMPSIKELENPEADLASEIYTADGVMMGKIYSQNRSEVKFHEISPNVINALVATEDERFFDHSGIDAQALARVLYSFGTKGGGSTITQQLAKMILGQGKGSVFVRSMDKIKEWIVAVKLEKNFTKEEIITLYLNRAPWGNVYGIRNASLTYFQKEPIDLNLEEAAVLVGMLKGFIYEPVRHPQAALTRRNVVINQMVNSKQHFLTQQEANKYIAKPLITKFKKIDENVGIAPYFRSSLVEELKKWAKDHKNPKTGEPYDIYRDGLRIYTTIDSKMQKYAEESVVQHMHVVQSKLNDYFKRKGDNLWKGHENVIENAMKFSERWKLMEEDGKTPEEIKKTFYKPVKMRIFSWWGDKNHERDTIMTPYDSIRYHKQILQTSFASIDARTGEIKCWVGGIDYRWFKYDHVSAYRQVGSTFKPLLYTLAVTQAGFTPQTSVPGGSVKLSGKTISSGGGSLANCLAHSKNGAAWYLMSIVGVDKTIEFAKACGIKATLPHYPSIALGSAEIPMIEMLQSYTMFPNRGYNIPPVYINRIEDKNGNLIQEFPLAQSTQLIAESEAYSMVKMMQGVIQFGTARRLNAYSIPVEKAGKTGTTNNNTDGWFIGYTPELIAGTWVGCDDPFIPIYSNNSGGAEMAAPKWGLFMSKVYADKKLNYGKIKVFEKPLELMNDPIYADVNFAMIANTGDPIVEEVGNGDADDFMGDYIMDSSENFNIDMQENNNGLPPGDTGSKSKSPVLIDDKKKPVVPKSINVGDY